MMKKKCLFGTLFTFDVRYDDLLSDILLLFEKIEKIF
jgi:hypothetical protein